MNVLWDILFGISLVAVAMYAFFTIGAIWCIFHDAPSSSREQRVRSEQTIGSTPPNKSVYDAQTSEYQDDNACKRRERQAQAQWAMQEQMRIAREAHDTAARMHQEAHDAAVLWHRQAHDTAVHMQQEAHDTAVHMHQDSFSMNNPGGFGF